MRNKSYKRKSIRNIKRKGTKKNISFVMVGCSKKTTQSCRHKKNNNNNKKKKKVSFNLNLSNKHCPKCGPNCICGPNCKCNHPCPGNCYKNGKNNSLRGGAGCGSCGCPISPLSVKSMNMYGGESAILGIGQNGGNCAMCGQQGGSNFYKPIGPMPGPLVGSAWGPNKLPGENGIGSYRNYFKPYNTNNDPQQQMLPADADAGYLNKNSIVGGYTYKKRNSNAKYNLENSNYKVYSYNSKKGGGLVPQDLVNLGRDFNYNFKSAYNALNGYNAPVDPAPYKGQLTGAFNKRFMI
jgi:hypothetical protein